MSGRAVVLRRSIADLHALDPFAAGPTAGPAVWWCDFTDAAVVLGSRQPPDTVDADRCREAGLSIVRRRSGGGAVLLRPGDAAWVDLVLPHGRVTDDVRRSMVWAGERFAEVLERPVDVHRGGMVPSPWSDLVCFAGIGPGELLVGGRKLVGLSQRRTRHGVRIQATWYRRPVTGELRGLFAVPVPASPLDEPLVAPEVAPRVVAERLADLLSAL